MKPNCDRTARSRRPRAGVRRRQASSGVHRAAADHDRQPVRSAAIAAPPAWLFVRAAESIHLTRLHGPTPRLLVVGPGHERQEHSSATEDGLSMVQVALESRLRRTGWSFVGQVSCIHHCSKCGGTASILDN